jgi:hypothetical protein
LFKGVFGRRRMLLRSEKRELNSTKLLRRERIFRVRAGAFTVEGGMASLRTVLIEYPSTQSYVINILTKSFQKLLPSWTILTSRSDRADTELDLEWSDYDQLDFDSVVNQRKMISSYMIRKA